MTVRLHPHAIDRLTERGATAGEVAQTVLEGERFPAKYGRKGFRCNFAFDSEWRGKRKATKQIEAYAVFEADEWLVLSIITKYF